eukprot:gene3772-4349_t
MSWLPDETKKLLSQLSSITSGVKFNLINSNHNRKAQPSHIVFSCQKNMYLSSNSLDDPKMVPNPIPSYFPIAQNSIDRVSLVEVIPELSLVIVASQGPAKQIVLFRLKKNIAVNSNNQIQKEDYSIEPEVTLPKIVGEPSFIVGMSVVRMESKNPSLFKVKLYVLYFNGVFTTFEIYRTFKGDLDFIHNRL